MPPVNQNFKAGDSIHLSLKNPNDYVFVMSKPQTAEGYGFEEFGAGVMRWKYSVRGMLFGAFYDKYSLTNDSVI